MFEVKFFELDKINEVELSRVVLVSKYNNKWVFAKKKEKGTWEIPGGHIEPGEDWQTAAKREMFEETGATKINVKPICIYTISKPGLLCFAEIEQLDSLPNFEMSEIGFFDDIPQPLTYPDTHTMFFELVKSKI